MNFKVISRIIGMLVLLEAVLMMLCLAVGVSYGEDVSGFAISAASISIRTNAAIPSAIPTESKIFVLIIIFQKISSPRSPQQAEQTQELCRRRLSA